MPRDRLSVALLVAIVLVGSTTLVLAGFAALDRRNESARLERQLDRELDNTVAYLALSLALPIARTDDAQVESILRHALRDNDLIAISVRPSAPSGRTRIVGRTSNATPAALDKEPQDPTLRTRSARIVHYGSATGANDDLGVVSLYATSKLMHARQARYTSTLITNIVATELVLVAALFVMLWLLVIRPVRFLEQQASAIGRGERDLSTASRMRFLGEPEKLRVSLLRTIELLEASKEKVTASEQRFRLAVEGANDGIWDWDIATDSVYYSQRFLELLKYESSDEFPPVVSTFRAHVHPDDAAHAEAAARSHLENCTPFDIELRLLTRQGDYRWFRSRGQCVRNEAGVATRMVGCITDIHEEKSARQALQTLQMRELQAREEFARHLITAQEQERRRLANELHDSLGQSLSLIKNRVQLALEHPAIPRASAERMESVIRTTVDAIAEVRALAHNLRPLHIERLGLIESLLNLVEQTRLATSIEFATALEDVSDLFDHTAATHLYRIVQESLTNVVRHAGATHVRITIERDLHCVRLSIRDDGCGFEPDWRATHQGVGLTSIAERARILGGTLAIDSAPGHGTRLTIEMPMSEATLSASGAARDPALSS
jgi:two-component system sensor histidine kinase UhpB